MTAVLLNEDGYFTKMADNKFYLRVPHTSSDLQDATIFRVSIVAGTLKCEPELPEGDWEIRPVKFELAPEKRIHD